jgi:hypothetical protein
VRHFEVAGRQCGGIGGTGGKLVFADFVHSDDPEQFLTELSRAEAVQEKVDGRIDDDAELGDRKCLIDNAQIGLKRIKQMI